MVLQGRHSLADCYISDEAREVDVCLLRRKPVSVSYLSIS